MNVTEERAHAWLLRQGHTDITFHRTSTPDFITSTGEKFEVKKVRNNVIWFSPKQIKQLSAQQDTMIIVMNDSESPVAVFPYSEVKDGYWNNIKIAGGNYGRMVNFSIDEDLWRRAKAQAALQGVTLQDWVTSVILRATANSKETKTE